MPLTLSFPFLLYRCIFANGLYSRLAFAASIALGSLLRKVLERLVVPEGSSGVNEKSVYRN